MERTGLKTLSLEIMEEIENMIRSGKIKPGEALPSERELCAELGVSRPPIREALHALRALGIIDIHAGGGTYLRKDISVIKEHFKTKALLTKYTTIELTEARTVIEVETVSLAIKRATDEDIDKIKFFMDKAEQYHKIDTYKFLECDFDFHKAIAMASKNFVLAEMLETTRTLLYSINAFNILEPGHPEAAVKMHIKIFNAIKAKDEPLAKELMKEHIKTIIKGIDYFIDNK